jgi:hypothetical protein
MNIAHAMLAPSVYLTTKDLTDKFHDAGLSVHMNQVHKESLDKVENALPNRNGLDIEIFGMEGVPEDVIAQHSQRIIQSYYQEQAERYAATGNPPPGQNGGQRPVKKIKIENPDEIKARLKEWLRTKKERAERGAQNGGDAMAVDEVPGQSVRCPSQAFS